MKITVSMLLEQNIFVLDVSPDLELENFKAFCEIESGVPANETVIIFNGRPLYDNKKSLREHGLTDNDVVILQQMHNNQPSQPTANTPINGSESFFCFIKISKSFDDKTKIFLR